MPGTPVSQTLTTAKPCFPDGCHRVWGSGTVLARPPARSHTTPSDTNSSSPLSLLSSELKKLEPRDMYKPPLPLFLSSEASYHSLPLELHRPCILSFWLGTNHAPEESHDGLLSNRSSSKVRASLSPLVCSRLQAPRAIEMVLNTWHHHPVPIHTSIKKQNNLQANTTRAAVGTH